MVEFFLFRFILLRVTIEPLAEGHVADDGIELMLGFDPVCLFELEFEDGQYVDGLIQARATCLMKS